MEPLGMQVWCDHPSPANTTNWVPSSGWSCWRNSIV